MSRRDKIENIIIGTLLESNGERNYFDDCRSCVTADMFNDPTNRRIYGIIEEMNASGNACTDPCSIFTLYGENVLDIVTVMADRMAEDSFIHLKIDYNERRYIASLATGSHYKPTDVTFADYVNQFIKMAV